MSRIFNMFGQSPIKPLEKHMRKSYNCAEQLYPFFEAILANNWEEATQIKDKISKLETEADKIKKELRLQLPSGLFLPVARTDLLQLLSAQDRIANKAEDISGLMIARKMVIPEELSPHILPFLEKCLDAAKLACKAINELDELLESGFRGSELQLVEKMIVTLDKIEHESDAELAGIKHYIFKLEKDLPALDIIFLYQVVQWIGDLADRAQVVGGLLQILIAG